tara:strand:+ start:228 stop:545 length:318 start_codon:yes stop_codon:yes gene_type:complete
MAKELNPYSTSGSADYNEDINKYMMDLGQGAFKTPLAEEGATGPMQTTQTNPANGTSVKTGETASNINNTVPNVYGAGTGTINDVVSNNDTILKNEDEDPNQYIA